MKTDNLLNNIKTKRKRMVAKASVFIIFFLFFINFAVAADDISLKASVDRTAITLNDSLNLTITVTGATNTSQPTLPAINDFNLVFGPSVSTRTSIINGAVSVSKGFSYVLKPKAAGSFTIGAFTLHFQGKSYKSNTLTVNVVDRKNPPKLNSSTGEIDLSKLVFVKFETDKVEAFTYEQIILTFRFYYQRGMPITDVEYVAPEIRNFIKEDMGQQSHYEEAIGGVMFNVVELRTALFPVVTGALQISPATLKCNLVIKSKRRRQRNDIFGDSFFDDFFGSEQTKYSLERQTDPITIAVNPLPEVGKPDDFNGAVGDYTMDVDIKPAKVNVGDPITMTMTVKGEGNIQTITEPSLYVINDKDFKIYPSETETKVTARKKSIKGEMVFKKVIEPQNDKISHTPAVTFSFFNPKLKQYQTLKHEALPMEVEAGEFEAPIRLYVRETDANNKDKAAIITKDILPIMASFEGLSNHDNFLYRSPILFAVLFAPMIAVGASILVQRQRKKLVTDVSYARKRRAKSTAKSKLMAARGCMNSEKPEEFYTALSNSITAYLADKLNTTAASISPNTVETVLSGANVAKETVGKLVATLEQCDFGRFAKDAGSTEAINEAMNNAEDLINELERELK